MKATFQPSCHGGPARPAFVYSVRGPGKRSQGVVFFRRIFGPDGGKCRSPPGPGSALAWGRHLSIWFAWTERGGPHLFGRPRDGPFMLAVLFFEHGTPTQVERLAQKILGGAFNPRGPGQFTAGTDKHGPRNGGPCSPGPAAERGGRNRSQRFRRPKKTHGFSRCSGMCRKRKARPTWN